MHEAGTIRHYFEWQPTIDREQFTVDLRPMDGNWGDSGYAFVCIIGRNNGETEQLPLYSASAWSTSASEAQYYAFKQAAYYIAFNTIPPSPEVGSITEVEERMTGVQDLRIVPEYDRE